ncbi:MAG: imidazole glycerol phosphate synthase subunit HisH [Ignavibacteria bacterium]|jgi:glutamine amidotransferase
MIAIIDYDAGNVQSVKNALDDIGAEYKVTNSEYVICKADKIIFPGVGEAASAMQKLHLYNLVNLLQIVKKPILGICLGLQLFANHSSERDTNCLGIIDADVFKFNEEKITVPHMGWNKVKYVKESKLFNGITDNSYFYFANSYYLESNKFTIALTKHDVDFSSAIEYKNYYGVQFHPEKSGEAGIKLLKNFIELC